MKKPDIILITSVLNLILLFLDYTFCVTHFALQMDYLHFSCNKMFVTKEILILNHYALEIHRFGLRMKFVFFIKKTLDSRF